MNVVELEAPGPPWLCMAMWQGVCSGFPGEQAGVETRTFKWCFGLLQPEQRPSLLERAGREGARDHAISEDSLCILL